MKLLVQGWAHHWKVHSLYQSPNCEVTLWIYTAHSPKFCKTNQDSDSVLNPACSFCLIKQIKNWGVVVLFQKYKVTINLCLFSEWLTMNHSFFFLQVSVHSPYARCRKNMRTSTNLKLAKRLHTGISSLQQEFEKELLEFSIPSMDQILIFLSIIIHPHLLILSIFPSRRIKRELVNCSIHQTIQRRH